MPDDDQGGDDQEDDDAADVSEDEDYDDGDEGEKAEEEDAAEDQSEPEAADEPEEEEEEDEEEDSNIKSTAHKDGVDEDKPAPILPPLPSPGSPSSVEFRSSFASLLQSTAQAMDQLRLGVREASLSN